MQKFLYPQAHTYRVGFTIAHIAPACCDAEDARYSWQQPLTCQNRNWSARSFELSVASRVREKSHRLSVKQVAVAVL